VHNVSDSTSGTNAGVIGVTNINSTQHFGLFLPRKGNTNGIPGFRLRSY
jgi:hypothetical protein